MNLQESIKRILREDKDYTKLLKGIIDSSDIFDYKHFCGFDIITPEERSDQYNFLNKNKIPYLIKVYFVGGPNSEVWPRTQAIRNKELDLMEELHEYIKSFVPFNIEMMGSHVNSCEGYDKLMKRKYSTDDLQESIRRILREDDYSPAGKEITPNSIIVHKSNPMFRDKIMEEGLKVRTGECYKIFVGYGVKCKPAIFATNSTNKRAWFDSTYDDDIWFIDTRMIPDVKWYKDRHFESTKKHIVTFQDIPREALTLHYEGTGSGDVKTWDKNSPNLYESIGRILREDNEIKSNYQKVINNFKKILPESYSEKIDEVFMYIKDFIDKEGFQIKVLNNCQFIFKGVRTKNFIIICSPESYTSLAELVYIIFHEIRHEIQMGELGQINPLSGDLENFDELYKMYWEMEMDAHEYAIDWVNKIENIINLPKRYYKLSSIITEYPTKSHMVRDQIVSINKMIKELKRKGYEYNDISDLPFVKKHLDKLEELF